MAETITFRHLRARLPEVLDRAEAGDVTVVTRDGGPVGAFVPMGVLRQAGLWEEDRLRRVVGARRDSPTVPMAEVLAETRERTE